MVGHPQAVSVAPEGPRVEMWVKMICRFAGCIELLGHADKASSGALEFLERARVAAVVRVAFLDLLTIGALDFGLAGILSDAKHVPPEQTDGGVSSGRR